MFCEKCGSKLNEVNKCPVCYEEKPKNICFVLSIISIITSFLAFSVYIIIFGILFSFAVLLLSFILYKKKPTLPKIGLSITLSAVGLITNIIWYVVITTLL